MGDHPLYRFLEKIEARSRTGMKGRRVILWNDDEVTVMEVAWDGGQFWALVRYDDGGYKTLPLTDMRDAEVKA